MIHRLTHVLLGAALILPANATEPTENRGELFKDWRTKLASASESLAAGDDERAGELYRSVLEESRIRGENGILVARAADGLADLHRARHRFELAVPLYERSAAMWTRLLGDSQPRRAVTLHNLGICYVELADWPAAEEVLLQALSVWREHGEPQRMRETQQVLDAALERRTIPWGAETR
jgi:Tfp pilus assembly protein PilF